MHLGEYIPYERIETRIETPARANIASAIFFVQLLAARPDAPHIQNTHTHKHEHHTCRISTHILVVLRHSCFQPLVHGELHRPLAAHHERWHDPLVERQRTLLASDCSGRIW